MKISILNCPKKITRKYIKQAIEFYGLELMSSRVCENLNITVKFFKELGGKTKGYCDFEEDYCVNPRNFIIGLLIAPSKKNLILNIAHEMVHIKQYVTGEMKDIYRPPMTIRFKGKMFHDVEVMDEDKSAYWSYPWEIEAYKKERGLYSSFMKHLNEIK